MKTREDIHARGGEVGRPPATVGSTTSSLPAYLKDEAYELIFTVDDDWNPPLYVWHLLALTSFGCDGAVGTYANSVYRYFLSEKGKRMCAEEGYALYSDCTRSNAYFAQARTVTEEMQRYIEEHTHPDSGTPV